MFGDRALRLREAPIFLQIALVLLTNKLSSKVSKLFSANMLKILALHIIIAGNGQSNMFTLLAYDTREFFSKTV
jgi:hypothetical protein